ncbi:MAG: hypothetical protein ACU836_01330 [Gammaproteobacteria bacterium]
MKFIDQQPILAIAIVVIKKCGIDWSDRIMKTATSPAGAIYKGMYLVVEAANTGCRTIWNSASLIFNAQENVVRSVA